MFTLANLNWVDLVIIAVFLFYIIEGWGVGFVQGLFQLASIIASFALSLKFYTTTGQLLMQNFPLPHGISNAIGFFLTAFLLETIFSFLSSFLFKRISRTFFENSINRLLGILPGMASAAILLAFFLTLILTLPFSPLLKKAVASSKIGSLLTLRTAGFERLVNQVFGQAVHETINFITIKPGERAIIDLRLQVKNLSPDAASEEKMLALINNERKERGFSVLMFDNRLRDVARLHARDMFTRGYFSHYTPEGLSALDRLATSDINFNIAGENLAFAPSVVLAHDGLMESPGHRENILSAEFRRVGIGVIDGGIYGKMFVQEFTD